MGVKGAMGLRASLMGDAASDYRNIFAELCDSRLQIFANFP